MLIFFLRAMKSQQTDSWRIFCFWCRMLIRFNLGEMECPLSLNGMSATTVQCRIIHKITLLKAFLAETSKFMQIENEINGEKLVID